MGSVEECYRGHDVRVFRLDCEGVLERLRRRALALVETNPEVVEVWLFGSLARGAARPGSDADLFVVILDTEQPFLDRIPPLTRHFSGVGVGCDVIVYTQSERAALVAKGGRFAQAVLEEGALLAARARPAR